MQDIRRISVRELAYKINEYNLPRFAFFLGAGASKQSGIPVASDMIHHFKEQIIRRCCPEVLNTNDEKAKWLTEQDWYQADGSEYGKFFERYEPSESGRHLYIESIMEGRSPSFGYMVLANLMGIGCVDTIITTNFDDLIYSACLNMASVRPIVYAYGTFAFAMRSAHGRPKILKLHGDYLFTNLRNLDPETKKLDPNMCNQVRQILMNYELIVVGYSGGDLSIIKILGEIPQKGTLYWCVRRGEKINEAVEKLLYEKEGFLIEIDGFDEMMSEVGRAVGLDVTRMFGSIEEHRNEIIRYLEEFEPRYSAEILGQIPKIIKESNTKAEKDKRLESLDFFSRAYEAQKENDISKAEELYRKTIELNPNYAHAYNNLGKLLNDLKHYDEAEAALRKAIEFDPDNVIAYNNLGNALSGLKNYEEAEAAYRKAIELNPNYTLAYTSLGIMLEALKRYDEAEAALRKAIEFDPDNVIAYNNLGNALSGLKNYEEAEAAYRKAIELDPSYTRAYYNLGILLEALKHYEEAEAAYREAIKLNPNYTLAYTSLGILLEALKHYDEAEAVYHNLGAVLRDLKRYEEAEAAFRKAIMLNSNEPSFYTDLGILFGILKRYEEAEAAYRKAIELNPNYTLAYSNFAVLLRTVGRYNEAEIIARKAVELEPHSSYTLNSLALSLRLSGRETEALTFAERARRLAPRTPLYLMSLAAMHKKLGHQAESSQYAAQARELIEPDDWYNLACLESISGNTDAAIENLRQATQEDELNADWASHDPDFEGIRDDPRFKEIVGEEGG